ncbi:hypothetical protein LTR09_003478 [Extremus antarcticus]|uniref:DUF6590 domain-containing protein n=1 Tax=Extremus antarcticus TaxID=702011 RepID=A0AAJ0DJY5_9PEZI|nr:hypothetical protein LTR09_003478 [Extremus antarcticus]
MVSVVVPPTPPTTSNGPPQTNAWNNSGGTSLVVQGLSVATAKSQQRLTVNTQGPRASNRNSQGNLLAAQMSQMSLQTPGGSQHPKVYNPSLAPRPSQITTYPRGQNSQVSTVSRAARRVANNVCVLSGYTKHNFQLGEIITIPLHQPDLNPHADPNDQCLAHTIQGPVYSKRRMVVVLWIYEEILFCVPLYTFGKRGPKYQGNYKPIEAQTRYPCEPTSTVHITGAIPVRCEEDIGRCGRVTEDSFGRLVDMWDSLYNKAKTQRYDQKA